MAHFFKKKQKTIGKLILGKSRVNIIGTAYLFVHIKWDLEVYILVECDGLLFCVFVYVGKIKWEMESGLLIPS